jgi:hypothetical protein
MFVALEALAEVVLLDESAAHEQVEGPVDRRFPDPLTPFAERGLDVVDGEVLVRAEHDLGDDRSLMRHWEAPIAQVAAE